MKKFALRRGWLDLPNERSLHHLPTPRLGGFGVLMTLLLGLACVAASSWVDLMDPLKWILYPAFFVASISLVDDLKGLPRGIRLMGHVIAAIFILWIFRGAWIGQPLPLLGAAVPAFLCGLLVFLWLVGLTNAYNFMDGIDGIAAIQGLVAIAGWCSVLVFGSGGAMPEYPVVVFLVILGGALLGFLVHNWSPAGIFFGDSGSTFLGFFLASIPLALAAQGMPLERMLEAGALFVWPFVTDTGLTFTRRLVLREPVFEPHRTHIYQRLAASFESREQGHQVTSLIYGLLALVGLGMFWTTGPLVAKLAVLACLWIAVYLWVVFLRPKVAEEPVKTENARQFDIYLIPPDIHSEERRWIHEALDSGYIAPVGPQVDAFERKLSEYLCLEDIQVVNSGTSAIHLGLRALGVGPGDCVLCPDLTFIASVNPIRYLGADPCLVDVDAQTWAMDVERARDAIAILKAEGRTIRAIVAVHAYGIPAPMPDIMELAACEGIPVLEDCAGALGSTIGNRPVGSFGDAAILSFNGNKVLTTSGGGALYLKDPSLRQLARSLANQGKAADTVGYRHELMGYNYRLSNICAAIGLGQFSMLQQRLERKRNIHDAYRSMLGDMEGIQFMPAPVYGQANHWLNCIGTGSPEQTKAILSALRSERIEAVSIWQPMHQQPANAGVRYFGGEVSDYIASHFLSLPSGSQLGEKDVERICRIIRSA